MVAAGLGLAAGAGAAPAVADGVQYKPIPLFTETFTGARPDVDGGWVRWGSAGLTKAPDGTEWAPQFGADLPNKNHATGDKTGPNGTQSLHRRGAPEPSESPGYLQLTDNNHDKVGGVLFDLPLLAAGGLDITFEQYQYNSTTPTIPGKQGPADGIGFFLTDGRYPLTKPGAFGGSLGYAQKIKDKGADIPDADIPGVSHGYLGVGLDVLGNYGCGYEGRLGGAGGGLDNKGEWLCAPNSVTLRGPGDGIDGYRFLTSNSVGGHGLGSSASTPDPAKRTVRITITPQAYVTVYVEGELIVNYQMTEKMPDTFKFGFTASTGDMTDVHLIRNIQVSTLNPWTPDLFDAPMKSLKLTKVVTEGDPKTEIFQKGDKVPYTFTVTNTGNTALTNVTVVDERLDQGSLVPSSVDVLSVGETAKFTGTRTLTEADITHGVNQVSSTFTNTATARGHVGEDPEPVVSNEATAVVTVGPAKGSITITKLLDPTSVTQVAPGHAVSPEILSGTGATRVDGVKFEVAKVSDIDLTTVGGWQAAAGLAEGFPGNLEELRSPDRLHEPVVRTTGHLGSDDADQGVAYFGDLPLGLYLVTETAAPDNVVPSSKPFLITVPMTNPDTREDWEYDVFVYPKNETVSLEKSVLDADAASMIREGDVVNYTVSMDVPEGATEFVITDQLDDDLDYVTDSIKDVDGRPLTLSAGSDVKVNGGGDKLEVTFTAIEGSFLSGTVGFTFQAKVLNAGEISNDATYVMTVHGTPVNGGSDEVETRWGGYDVLKVDEDYAPLADAEFTLFEVRYVVGDGGEVIEEQKPIAEKITSDEFGNVALGALRYSRWANGQAILTGVDKDKIAPGDAVKNANMLEEYVFYRLVETKAPDTYELQPRAFDFEVTGPADYNFDDPEEETLPDLTIVNVPQNAGFELPVIGGNRAVLPILAAVVAAGGVVWLIRSRQSV